MAVLGRGSTSLMSRPRADLPLLPLRLITDEPFLFADGLAECRHALRVVHVLRQP